MFDKEKPENKSQFIINNGIVYNKRDMLMLLRDLGNVTYFEIYKNSVTKKGHGYIMRVCVNSEEPTLFLNGRIYINVGVFDYLQLKEVKGKDNTAFELHVEDRVMRIIPDEAKGIFPSTSKETFADRIMGLDILTDELPPEGPPDQMISGEWSEN